MNKPKGISFEIGKDDIGWFWYFGKLKLLKVRPSRNNIDAKYGGFKFDIMFGKTRRPVSRFYKIWRFFFNKDYVSHETEFNPWNSGNHWFVWTIPFDIGFFISLSFWIFEIYFGSKTYAVNRISQNLKIYKPDRNDIIMDEIAWGDAAEKGNVYMCPSAAFRVGKILVD